MDIYKKQSIKESLRVDKIPPDKLFISNLSKFSIKKLHNNMNKLKLKSLAQTISSFDAGFLQKMGQKLDNNLLNNIKTPKDDISVKDLELYDIWEKDHDCQVRSLTGFISQQKPPKVPTTLQNISLSISNDIPNVKVVGSGMSYNPSCWEYQKLIEDVSKKSLNVIKNEKERKRKRRSSTDKRDVSEIGNIRILFKDYDSMEKVTDNGPIRKMIKKTKKQRKKELKKKEASEYNKRMQQKKQINDLNSIDKIVNVIEANTRKLTNINYSKKGHLTKRKVESVAVSPLDIQLSNEFVNSFRLFKPNGNMFIDRFKSLQERGLIDVRYPIFPYKKYSCRYVEKWLYKRFKLYI